MKLGIFTLGALVGLLSAAEAAAEDPAGAEALFQRGLDAMTAGRYAEGCAALAESHRLDPRLGTLFTLAECRAKEGKIATAVALYDDYLAGLARLPSADQVRHRSREKIAGEKKRSLGPHVPRLVIRLPTGVSASVTRDDVPLRPPSLGIPLPVDPGEHEITVQADHGGARRQIITVGLDEEKVVDLEVVSPDPMPPLPSPPPMPGPRVERPSRSEVSSAQRTAAWVAGGIGAAALVVGAGTGAAVLVKKGTVSDQCFVDICTTRGLQAVQSARSLGAASTTGFVLGGAGIGAAIVLFLTDRPAREPARAGIRPVVGGIDPRGAWVGAGGEW